VGKNAEIVAWKGAELSRCPYPLDLALERFHMGEKLNHALFSTGLATIQELCFSPIGTLQSNGYKTVI
jgi:hypothetical protein